MQWRPVRSHDPSLSDRANAVLTDELRRVVGADAVEVPADRAHVEDDRHGGHNQVLVTIVDNRLAFVSGAFALLVFGAILSLLTHSWWFLGVAALVDLIGTIAVAAIVFQMTGETEHLSPEATALLEDEGVEDPDAVFNALVAEYAAADSAPQETRRPPESRPPA